MNGSYLLDTNVVIALFAKDAAAQDRVAKAPEVFVPSIVLGELVFGAYKSQRVAENIARIDEFEAESKVLDCDAETARHYGRVRQQLRAKSRPLPENDLKRAQAR